MVKDFFVYMMTNFSRTVLYIGVTNDLERRVWEHRHGEIDGFTKRYKLDRLVYFEQVAGSISAIAREKELKGWRRAKKNELVRKLNPKSEDLGANLFGEHR